MTNAEFAKTDKVFIKACELAGLEKSTTRQASKYRMKRGLAYDKRKEALKIIKEDGQNEN
jgi:hypothetical protein